MADRKELMTGAKVKGVVPTSMEEAFRLATAIVASGMAPPDVKTQEGALVIILSGLECGMPPMQAIQRIALINGRTTIWGDAAIGLVRASGLLDSITDPLGNLVWLSPALPGRTHDLTAARTHAIIDALTRHQVTGYADKAYQGAGGTIATPRKPHKYRRNLTPQQKWVNHAHSAIRAHGERANAMLKTWRILTKLRCCPAKATTITQAIAVLHHIEHPPPAL